MRPQLMPAMSGKLQSLEKAIVLHSTVDAVVLIEASRFLAGAETSETSSASSS